MAEPINSHAPSIQQQQINNPEESQERERGAAAQEQSDRIQGLFSTQSDALRTNAEESSHAIDLPNGPMGTLSRFLLQHIASFLSYRDQGRLAQAARFTRDAAHEIEQYYIDCSMAPLKTEIEALSAQRPASFSVVHAIWGVPIDLNSTAAPLAREDFQRLLVSLVTSPAIGHPIHWVPVMNTLMAFGDNERVQRLAGMADLLATSARPISSDQVYQFCTYLAREQLPGFIPWFGYQVLDQFSQKLPLSSAGVNEILEEYLTKKAEELLKAQDKGYYLPNNRIFKIKTTNIDPRVWFGSLLTSHEQMPELLLEVLWARIQLLHASCTDRPFEVGMMGREEAQLPHNFTLALAQRITNAKIFLDYGGTVDEEQLNPEYVRLIGYLSTEQKEALVTRRYPNAVVERTPEPSEPTPDSLPQGMDGCVVQ